MIGISYFLDPKTGSSNMPYSSETSIKVATSVGTLIGQLFFGWLADIVGRKRMYGYELLIITLATFGQCISGPSPAISITGLLVFWRVTMGLGIGGDYPLSSVITSEFATTKLRGTMIAAVFATQALGQFIASVVALIVTTAFRNTQLSQTSNAQKNYCNGSRCYYPSPSSVLAADRMWRIIVGFGAIPAAFALYFRLTIPETPRYTFDVNRDSEQGLADYRAWVQNTIGPRNGHGQVASEREPNRTRLNNEPLRGLNQQEVPESSWQDFKHHFGQWKNFQVLLGTAGTWFFLDAAYYALTLNNTVFLQKVGFGSVDSGKNYSLYTFLREGAVGNLILATAGGIPGSLLTIYLVDKVGRKPILMLGFAMTTLLLLVLGSAFSQISEASRLALYVLCLFFFNFGESIHGLDGYLLGTD
jgi:MFS transporter, PHS family, inorganic phosphate transporter